MISSHFEHVPLLERDPPKATNEEGKWEWPFRFEKMWTRDLYYNQMVRTAWMGMEEGTGFLGVMDEAVSHNMKS